MTEPNAGTAVAGQLLRISVQSGERSNDLGVPGVVPVIEVLPSLARRLNLFQPETAHSGFRMVRADGHVLDLDRSLVAQGVVDGDVLALEVGGQDVHHDVYDDIVEAVADVVERESNPWSAQDTATTTTVAAAVLLAAACGLLLAAGLAGATLVPTIVAGLGGVVLLACAVVLDRTKAPVQAAVALVLVAALYTGVAGFVAAPEAPGWGQPLVFGGAAMAVTGVAGFLLGKRRREYALIPAVVGLVLGGGGAAVAYAGASVSTVLVVAMAVAGVSGLGIPWLALASTPLRVVSARDDSEIYTDIEPIEHAAVRERYQRGLRFQVALRIATGVVALVATPVVIATGWYGLAMAVLCYLGMLLGARVVYSRADIITVATTAMLGAVLTVYYGVLTFPGAATALVIAVALVAALVVGMGLLVPARRLWLSRLGDPAELITIALLLPLAVLAAGLV